MKPFEYFEPQSVDEALALLKRFKEEAKILAGGTDLLVQMKHKKIAPKYLISIRNIPGLSHIEYDEGKGLTIGASATITEIEDSLIIQNRFTILHQAVRELGTQQVRNIATIGGNLCNASPAAETAPALIALGASVRIASCSEERVVKLEDFFVGPGATVLKTGEMLTEIYVSNPKANSRGIYLKHALRKKLETAIVGLAILANFNGKRESFEDIRIVLGAVAPTPKRALKAENLARGKRMNGNLLEEVTSIVSEESNPITDLRATAEYRKEMVKVLIQKGIQRIMNL